MPKYQSVLRNAGAGVAVLLRGMPTDKLQLTGVGWSRSHWLSTSKSLGDSGILITTGT